MLIAPILKTLRCDTFPIAVNRYLTKAVTKMLDCDQYYNTFTPTIQ
jgi:hypothetical protein